MALAALRTSVASQDDPVSVDTGYELGWDHAHHGVVPPAAHLHPLSPVRHGWEAGKTAFGQRTLHTDRFVHRWLQLRLQSWLRGHAVESTRVNPSFLRQIDVPVCPITRELLTDGFGTPSDAAIARVCDGAAYAAGNLAMMSRRALDAKSTHGHDAATTFAQRIDEGQVGGVAGLNAEQWSRLATLLSFATPMSHARAALVPLLVVPPNRVRVLNPVQSLQVMLSLQFTWPGHGRRCTALAALMPTAEAKQAFHPFMLTLLARRVAAGAAAGVVDERRIVEETWRDPLVNRRWQRLALRLTADDCERISRLAAERGLAGSGLCWLAAEQSTEGWALASAGLARGDMVTADLFAGHQASPATARIERLSHLALPRRLRLRQRASIETSVVPGEPD